MKYVTCMKHGNSRMARVLDLVGTILLRTQLSQCAFKVQQCRPSGCLIDEDCLHLVQRYTSGHIATCCCVFALPRVTVRGTTHISTMQELNADPG